ncbi:hypothetical protein ACIQHY_34310 [Streptomyces sp. NPDC092359]|uniref:hypothetical protein n=1 Tax=Streptomyces sp. NPDC092359 TaxID=3366014 RepID=UPI0037F8C3CD
MNARKFISAAVISVSVLTGLTAAPASASPDQEAGERLTVTDSRVVEGKQILTFDNGAKFTSGPPVENGILSSFTWGAKFQIGFNTRTYTSNTKGTHTFQTGGLQNLSGVWNAGCTDGASIEVTLYAEDWPTDAKIGTTRKLSCTNGGSTSWTNTSPDTFYYYVKVTGNWDSNDLYSRGLNGSVTYP